MRVAVKAVGFDDVRTRTQVLAMGFGHRLGLRQAEHVVVALHRTRVPSEALATEILLDQTQRLQLGAVGTVENVYA